jgi:hypothetical protein
VLTRDLTEWGLYEWAALTPKDERRFVFSRFKGHPHSDAFLVASHAGGAPADAGTGDGMADNPNATSANPNAMMNPDATSANPNATIAASGSLVGHGEGQQQRSRNDNQQPFHAKPPLGDYGEWNYPAYAKLKIK